MAKRLLCVLLSVLMVVAMLPMGVVADDADTSSWQLALLGFDGNYSGWTASSETKASTGSLKLSATVQAMMDANSIESIDSFGGFQAQIWNLSSTDEGATYDYVISVNGEELLTGSGTVEVSEYNATSITQVTSENAFSYGSHEFATDDTVTVVISNVQVASEDSGDEDDEGDVEDDETTTVTGTLTTVWSGDNGTLNFNFSDFFDSYSKGDTFLITVTMSGTTYYGGQVGANDVDGWKTLDNQFSSDDSCNATATLTVNAQYDYPYGGGNVQLYWIGDGSVDVTVTCEKVEETSTTTPTFYGKTLSLGGTIGVNFYVDFTDVDGADDYYVEFTVDGTTTEVYSSGTDANGYYKYTCSVPCWEMGTTIEAVLTNGDTVADTCTYSVETYANNMKSASTELGNLVTAMLEYGNCAATYNSKSTTVEEVAGNIKNVTADDLADYKADVADDADASMLEAYLSLYYSCDLSFELNGGYTMTIDGVEADTIENILVQDWDKTYEIVIYNGDEAVCSVTYSVLSYAYTVVANSDEYDESLVNLVKAMYLYNVAADAYIG